MATHSSTLAWRIPRTEEPGRLQSMGVEKSQTRLSDLTFTFTKHTSSFGFTLGMRADMGNWGCTFAQLHH